MDPRQFVKNSNIQIQRTNPVQMAPPMRVVTRPKIQPQGSVFSELRTGSLKPGIYNIVVNKDFTQESRVDLIRILKSKPKGHASIAPGLSIDLNEIKEPLLACPNDPDDIKTLSEIGEVNIDEVFIGSCMTNIGHFRAAGKLLKNVTSPLPTRLWISPPTRMDKFQLEEEGFYEIYKNADVRTEVPGCSLCMGNQARVEPNSTVVSTSTRNFPNRLGDGADVFLASAELAAISSILGKLPSTEEYNNFMKDINTMSSEIFRYMNFNEIASYKNAAENAVLPSVTIETN